MDIVHGFISVDDHVQEHPTVWTDRLSAGTWGDRIPQVREAEDGTQHWTIDETPVSLPSVALAGALMPDRAREPQRWEDVPKAAYDAEARLQIMDAGGIDASVLYPTIAGRAGETFGRLKDRDLELACVQAYNDWVVEEWAAVSDRFVPQCITPRWPVEAAVAEVERAVGMGHKGVIIPPVPDLLGDFPHINEPDYDPLWATCQALGVPIGFHSGSSPRIEFPPYKDLSESLAAALAALTGPASSVQPLANFLFSPMSRKFPDLQVVFAESSLTYGAYELETADHQSERQRMHLEGFDPPSQVFRRQCHLSGWYDRIALKTRAYLGIEQILWESNLPLATSTWPNTQTVIDDHFRDIPPDEREQILWRNAADLYHV